MSFAETIRDIGGVYKRESHKRRTLEGMDISVADPNDVYDSDYVKNHEQTDRFGRIERLVPLMRLEPSDTLLDVGCGFGFLGDYVTDIVDTYHGIDRSKNFIREARQRYFNRRNGIYFYHLGMSNFLKLEPRPSIHVIAMIDLVEHVGGWDLGKMLNEARPALYPGGRLYIYTPNSEFIIERLKAWGVLPQQVDHIAVRSGPEYEQMLRDAGFENIKVSYISHYVPMLKWMHRLSGLPIIGKYFKARIWIEVTI